MRISFLAVVAVALLVGLGSVVAIRSLGLLGTPTVPLLQPMGAPPPPLEFVLVGLRPLYAGDPIMPGNIGARPLLPYEVEEYNKHRDEYLPGVPAGAYYRFVKQDIPGNQPLKKSDLEDIHRPEPIHTRLLPGSRAVNIEVSKNHSSGGLIQRGDWVDVYLNTTVARTDNPNSLRRTGLVVGRAHVVAKRDSLVNVYTPIPENVAFTLAMNPYRAALLEFARTVGTIVLEPVSQEEKARLDKLALEAENDLAKAELVTIGDPTTREAMEEKERIVRMNVSGLAIGAEDLARALQLKTLEPPVLQRLPRPTEIEVYSGSGRSRLLSFSNIRSDAMMMMQLPAPDYLFSKPDDHSERVPVIRPSTASPAPMRLTPPR